MKTRIAIITTVHPARDVRIYHKQAVTLSRAGYDVVLIAPAHLPKDGVDETLATLAPVRLPTGRLGRMAAGPLLILGAALNARAAVYHLHDPELLPAGLVLKMLGKRVVYDVHEDYPEQVRSKHYLPGWLRPLAAWGVGLVEEAVARRLDGVVAATDAIGARFSDAQTVVVRNYPRTTVTDAECRMSDMAPSSADAYGRVRSRPFRVVHLAGTLTEVRGITSIVRAMDYLDEGFELALAGRFVPAEYRQKLEGLAGFARVRHVEAMPHARVWHWYRRCDAGIVCSLPLRRHLVSLPVKMFEFMAAGLPVVVSRFPLWQDIVERHQCGICVDPEVPEEIAAAIRLLAKDRGKAREMGRNGRRAVIGEYNWQQEAEKLLALYRKLAASRKLPAQGIEELSSGPLNLRTLARAAVAQRPPLNPSASEAGNV